MQIIISKQHLNRFPQLAQYAGKKVAKLSRYNKRILTATIHLIAEEGHRSQGQNYICELVFDMPGNNLTISDSQRSMDKAIDRVVERAKKLIVKTKEKGISKKHQEGIAQRNKT